MKSYEVKRNIIYDSEKKNWTGSHLNVLQLYDSLRNVPHLYVTHVVKNHKIFQKAHK